MNLVPSPEPFRSEATSSSSESSYTVQRTWCNVGEEFARIFCWICHTSNPLLGFCTNVSFDGPRLFVNAWTISFVTKELLPEELSLLKWRTMAASNQVHDP